jgi:diacylglycerol kinase (ATP)
LEGVDDVAPRRISLNLIAYGESPVSIYRAYSQLSIRMVGIIRMMRCQHNAWIHAIATGVVIAAGFFFHLSASEWCWIVLAASTVWTAEALNTAFEFLADAASPNFHPVVRDAKDVAAGAVLITAIASSVIGAIIFWPHLKDLLSH